MIPWWADGLPVLGRCKAGGEGWHLYVYRQDTDILREMTSYKANPEAVPEGEEPVRWFLNGRTAGKCGAICHHCGAGVSCKRDTGQVCGRLSA